MEHESTEYEVTASRKRPRTFDELTGQEFVVATLKNALKAGRIAHAYLFSGPRGVGKTSAARILARGLNCPSGPTADLCEDYPGSEEIARGTSLDVIEIDGASNTSVNDVRQIKDEVLFAPNSSRYKIYIIDEVHMLSNSAFNALLKTIEEPPPYVAFIFATTELHKVPATIKSRCQQFAFRLISIDVIRDKLREVAAETGVVANDEALFWIAKEATGSLRDAYTLFDQVLSFSEGEITLEKIQDKLGLVGFDRLNELAEKIVAGETAAVLEKADEMLSAGISVEQFTVDLAEYFRSLMFIRHGVTKESVLGYPVDRYAVSVRDALTQTQIERGIALLFDLYRDIRYSLNPRFELELVLSRLAALGSYLTSREILDEIEAVRSAIRTGSADDPRPAPPLRQRVLEAEKVEEIVTIVRDNKVALASVLDKAVRWELDEAHVTIVFDGAYAANAVKQDITFVRDVVRNALDEAVNVTVTVESNDGEPREIDEKVELVRKVFRGEVVQ
ncbi:MAG: DNA polymerase III subunit gamma/tau [Spirochaetaceae bacterium]|nr:MAG: DNA polymerase III subunit gamma/tau [Spirochaetaceae bacterium]